MGYMYLLLPLLLVFYQRIYCHSDRPGYIKPETMPLRVTYDRNSEVQFGNILSPSATSSQPRLMWEASSSSLYTVLMIDPDAPSRADPSFRDFLHWLVVNVPGDELSRGFTAAPYRGPGPPKGTESIRPSGWRFNLTIPVSERGDTTEILVIVSLY